MARLVTVVLVLISIAVALAILETGLRFASDRRAATFVGSPVPADDLVSDPLLVAWFKPGYHSPDGTATYDNWGLRQNGDGDRIEPVPRPIALLGGSTAYGWDSPDDETITADMERDLNAAGHTTAVVNAGYPGLTTLDTVLVYQEKVAPLNPSTVIVLSGLNDLYYASDWAPDHRLQWINTTFEVGLRARHEPELRPLVDAIDRIALRNCFTCYYVSNVFSQAYNRTGFGPALALGQALDQQPMAAPNDRAMALTAQALAIMADRVQAAGGCFIVGWQPVAGVPSGARTPAEQMALDQVSQNAPSWARVAPQMFAQLRTDAQPLFASGKAHEVDLTGAFDNEVAPVYADDGVHYTRLGNRLLSTALDEAVSSSPCVPSS